MIRRLASLLTLVCLVSCQSPVSQQVLPPQVLPQFPLDIYRNASSGTVFAIDSEHSQVDIVVRRGGKLSHLGHDHVISVGRINGFALLKQDELTDSCADLRFELASLLVDEADSRKQFNLDTRPTEEDISKTGENMHGKVLYTQTWPQSHLLIEVSGGNLEILEAKLTVTLHGQQHSLPHSIAIEDFNTDGFKVHGSFSLLQSDFGIVPLSALGGGLTVQDRLEVNYAMQLRRLENPELIQATSNQFR